MTRIVNLRVEYLEAPLAIAEPSPRFSWELESNRRAVVQEEYRLVVALDDGEVLWYSSAVLSAESSGIAYAGPSLPHSASLVWTVTVAVRDEEEHLIGRGRFETAPDPEWWVRASWITLRRTHYQNEDNRPLPMLRTTVAGERAIRARLHVTAGGLAQVSVDGTPLDPGALAPDSTDKDERLPFHTFEDSPYGDGSTVTS